MEYKYELHCHTKTVSRCGRVEPEKIVKLYKEQGYSGIVVTDHYSPLTFDLKGYFMPRSECDFYLSAYHEMKKYEDDHFSVMLGMELRHYASANDYLIYGLEEEWLREQGNLMAVWERKMYRMMHGQGYLVYEAHPFRAGRTRCNPKYIDGVEVYNGKTKKNLNEKAYAWAKRTGKLMVSGSDFHAINNLAKGGIITDRPIRNNTELLETLKSQSFKLIQNY